ncbi:MAG: type II toxin-antitoxin system RelE/ParE family toxin [Candidatus Methylumidiphilus sp.]
MSKRVIFFHQKALEDIEEITCFIAEDSPKSALSFREMLEQACELLAEMPDMGVARNFTHPLLTDVRLWPLERFEKYLIFYRAQLDTLEIIRVLHGARDLPSLFAD